MSNKKRTVFVLLSIVEYESDNILRIYAKKEDAEEKFAWLNKNAAKIRRNWYAGVDREWWKELFPGTPPGDYYRLEEHELIP